MLVILIIVFAALSKKKNTPGQSAEPVHANPATPTPPVAAPSAAQPDASAASARTLPHRITIYLLGQCCGVKMDTVFCLGLSRGKAVLA